MPTWTNEVYPDMSAATFKRLPLVYQSPYTFLKLQITTVTFVNLLMSMKNSFHQSWASLGILLPNNLRSCWRFGSIFSRLGILPLMVDWRLQEYSVRNRLLQTPYFEHPISSQFNCQNRTNWFNWFSKLCKKRKRNTYFIVPPQGSQFPRTAPYLSD